jgi:predicted glycosyltransferase
MLYHARASVSFCGYNTALDILQAGTPAVFVPFDDGGETEQRLRATQLSRLSGIEVLATDRLSAESLLAAIGQATSAPRRAEGVDGPDGARRTVEIVSDLLGKVSE